MRKTGIPDRQRLLDIVDTAIFDYLISNMDRHHHEVFEKSEWQQNSSIIMVDNGRRWDALSKVIGS